MLTRSDATHFLPWRFRLFVGAGMAQSVCPTGGHLGNVGLKIFLSHASQDEATAESIAFSLRSHGYKVFLDRDDLPAGASYDQQIERAVNDSEIFIFLISPDSVAEGRYTMTELLFARHKWPDLSYPLIFSRAKMQLEVGASLRRRSYDES